MIDVTGVFILLLPIGAESWLLVVATYGYTLEETFDRK